MLDHQRDDFIVAEIPLTKVEVAIDRFARAQKLARIEAQLVKQLAQFPLAQRLDVIVNFFEIDATLTEQLVQFATLGSSGFFVNSDHKNVLRALVFVLRSLINLSRFSDTTQNYKNSNSKYEAPSTKHVFLREDSAHSRRFGHTLDRQNVSARAQIRAMAMRHLIDLMKCFADRLFQRPIDSILAPEE